MSEVLTAVGEWVDWAQVPAELRPKLVPGHPCEFTPGDVQQLLLRNVPEELAAYAEWFTAREQSILLSQQDPLNYGVEIDPCWRDARRLLEEGDDVLILGGNRATKSDFAAKLCVETVVGEKKNVWAFQEDENASIERQQPYILRYLPPHLRTAGKGKDRVTNISYTVKNGFPDGKFVTPAGSVMRFMSYKMDVKSLEGGELDFIWADELVPPDFLETLRYRLVTRGGKMVTTFTPIDGYSVSVKQYLDAARIVKTLPAPLLPQDQVLVPGCPRGHMPYILECHQPGRFVICFFTQFNPFNPYENLVKLLAKAKLAEIKCRAYGWPDKPVAGAFQKFGKVNIIPDAEVPKVGTNYMVTDPGGAKNWFILWARVDDLGRLFIYREWPDAAMGDWAEPDVRHDGKPGPAQRHDGGKSVRTYKQIILLAEGWDFGEQAGFVRTARTEVMAERLIDPRFGTMKVPGLDDGTNIVFMMEDVQRDGKGVVVGPSMSIMPAPACKVNEGTEIINEWLDYDVNQPVSIMNCPRLFVAESCRNTIYALQTWTGADGEHGATKDPVDCIKYLVKYGPQYLSAQGMGLRGGGSY